MQAGLFASGLLYKDGCGLLDLTGTNLFTKSSKTVRLDCDTQERNTSSSSRNGKVVDLDV